jgi:hypothetical protein
LWPSDYISVNNTSAAKWYLHDFGRGETSAKLIWTGRTASTRHQKPTAATWLAAGSGVRVAAGHIIQDRSVLG